MSELDVALAKKILMKVYLTTDDMCLLLQIGKNKCSEFKRKIINDAKKEGRDIYNKRYIPTCEVVARSNETIQKLYNEILNNK